MVGILCQILRLYQAPPPPPPPPPPEDPPLRPPRLGDEAKVCPIVLENELKLWTKVKVEKLLVKLESEL